MIKVGIIGCGKIAEVRHAPEYDANPNAEIVGYYDVAREKAEALAKRYGGRVFDSLEDLLAADLDAVSVCTANRFHAENSLQALAAGRHVLCEKPMAMTLEDCEAMVRSAEEKHLTLMIGLNQRYAKAHVKAKELLDSGEMGEVLTFETHFAHPGPEGWTGQKNSWFFSKKIAAFGAMADLGVHKTDLIHYLTGHKIVRVKAAMTTIDKHYPDGTLIDVDDNACAIYTLDTGAIGTMQVSWTNYGQENNSTKLYCRNGVLRLYDDPQYSLIVEKPDGTVTPYALDVLTSNKEQTSGRATNTGVIDAFIEALQNHTEPVASGRSALHAMKVVFADEESARTGKEVEVRDSL